MQASPSAAGYQIPSTAAFIATPPCHFPAAPCESDAQPNSRAMATVRAAAPSASRQLAVRPRAQLSGAPRKPAQAPVKVASASMAFPVEPEQQQQRGWWQSLVQGVQSLLPGEEHDEW
jgi:hypothetical protein